MNEEDQKKIQRLKILSELLDSKFVGPFGIRFGLDGILGFVPFIGDIITTLLSLSILVSAARLGAGPSVLIRMAFNILFENLVDMIPVLGSLFDFWWKSNNMNMKILEDHLKRPGHVSVTSRVVVLTMILTVFILLFLMAYLSWMILETLIGLLS